MFFAATTSGQRRFDLARRAADSALAPGRGGAWMRRDDEVLGTSVSVELWSEEHDAGEAAAAAVIAEMHRIERSTSPHRQDSELSRINREAATRAVPLSDEMARLIERAMHFSHLSGGAFDITHASVGRHRDAGMRCGEAAVGWRHLQLDPRARTLRFGHPDLCIDLGGFVKGHAVDSAAATLRRHGIRHAIVGAGGGCRVIGRCGGRPGSIPIHDAGRAGEAVTLLPLEEISIAIAIAIAGGDPRIGPPDDGCRHPIVDPSTGRSPASVRSVTILGPDGLSCEALSKSVFVLGVESGLQLIASLADVDALIVDAGGRQHRSAGWPDAGGDG
ncbi:MAG: hypothetical protein ABT20_08080 [Rubrivivax sp. SCN 70-15]|nr:MAG: hypothetical protein ABT20_08080 [Rubrivivax sp. SCN 70-15]